MIHDIIERRIVALTVDPPTNEKIENDLAKGQPCAKKATASKQQCQQDYTKTALPPKGSDKKPNCSIGQPSAQTGASADLARKKLMMHPSHGTTLAERTKPKASTEKNAKQWMAKSNKANGFNHAEEKKGPRRQNWPYQQET